jgi:hypothetical protein
VARTGFDAWWLFRDQQPVRGNLILQLRILGRISDIDPTRDNGDRAGLKRSLMRSRIDPAGETGDDGNDLPAQFVRKLPREAGCGGRCVACADDGDGRLFRQSRSPRTMRARGALSPDRAAPGKRQSRGRARAHLGDIGPGSNLRRLAPPRRARSGRAAKACSVLAKRWSNWA